MAVLSVTFCLFRTSDLFKLISLGLHLLPFDWLYWSPSWRGNSWWYELQPILPRRCNLYGSCSVWRFSGVWWWSVSFAILLANIINRISQALLRQPHKWPRMSLPSSAGQQSPSMTSARNTESRPSFFSRHYLLLVYISNASSGVLSRTGKLVSNL